MKTVPAATAKKKTEFSTTGKRKTSIARIWMEPGEGNYKINGRDFDDYFGREVHRFIVSQPFETTGTTGQFNIKANIKGGGSSGQADALKHAISRALLAVNEDYRKPLRKAGLLTRDSRKVERKKYGRRGARKSPQYSKR